MTQAETCKQRRAAFADDDPNAIALENDLLVDNRTTKSRFCITEYWGEVYIFEDGSAIAPHFAESQAVLPYSRVRITGGKRQEQVSLEYRFEVLDNLFSRYVTEPPRIIEVTK